MVRNPWLLLPLCVTLAGLATMKIVKSKHGCDGEINDGMEADLALHHDRTTAYRRALDDTVHLDRQCTSRELLPELGADHSKRWMNRTDHTRPLYDCTCPYLKASYFCPHARTDYPTWEPAPVTEGMCYTTSDEDLATDPIPPNTRVLFYGNSHLRQVLESAMCIYRAAITSREVIVAEDHGAANRTAIVMSPDEQCRGAMYSWRGLLTDAGCVGHDDGAAFSCCDDRAIFKLKNNASIHYHFAHMEYSKRISDAFPEFNTTFSDYDAIVANNGNTPKMPTEHVLEAARAARAASVPFVWLATYDGFGDITTWSEEERKVFEEADGKYIPINEMVKPMTAFSRGATEGKTDHHFCLPGPPNGIAELILRVLWAIGLETGKV